MNTDDSLRHARRPRATTAVLLTLLTLAASLVAACGAAPTEDWESKLKPCPTDADIGRFEAFDRVELRVYGEPDMTGEYEVSAAGTINFPLLGEIPAAGRRCDEIERELTTRLAAEVLREPSVVCVGKTLERTAVTVQGQVTRPGVVDFRKGMMLTDAIASVEGITVRAQANSMVITRKRSEGDTLSVVVPYESILKAQAGNVCLHPGDVIYVPEAVF